MEKTPARQRVVVAAFLHDAGEVLLARRSATKAIAPGKYHLPGGHVEHGERPEAALAREIREELGVSALVSEPLWTFSYCWGEDHTVGIVYEARLLGPRGEIRPVEGDLDECVWVAEQRLCDFLDDGHNHEAAVAGFARLRARGGEPSHSSRTA